MGAGVGAGTGAGTGVGFKNQERKRLYSWSRPCRQLPRKGREQSRTTIAGQATLAFSRDGGWFQGNILSPDSDAYTIAGRRRCRSPSSPPPTSSHPPASSPLPASSPPLPLGHLSPSSLSPGSQRSSLRESTSEADSLEGELVARVLASLDLEEEEEGEEGRNNYSISIMDYETGINHKVQGSGGFGPEGDCSLEGENLSFQCTSHSKGVRANKVIQKALGPGLLDQDMLVFQGPLSFSYPDTLCYPSSIREAQWCL